MGTSIGSTCGSKFDPDLLPKSFIQKRVRLNSKMHFVVRGRRMGSPFGNRIQNGDREFFLRPSTAQMDESVAQNHSKSTVSFGFLRSRVPTLVQKSPSGGILGPTPKRFARRAARAPRGPRNSETVAKKSMVCRHARTFELRQRKPNFQKSRHARAIMRKLSKNRKNPW